MPLLVDHVPTRLVSPGCEVDVLSVAAAVVAVVWATAPEIRHAVRAHAEPTLMIVAGCIRPANANVCVCVSYVGANETTDRVFCRGYEVDVR